MTDETDPTDTENPSDNDDTLGDAGKNAIKAERARAAAAERQLRAIQAELNEATSRAQSLETQNGELTQTLTAAERANLRLTVGLDKGLPKSLIERLQGDDAETLAADADVLLALIPAASPASTTPRPDPSQGARSPAASTPQAAFAAAMGPILNP